ncbi:collagen-like triple helix repeat-containing protein, partial [Bacillus cereus]
MSRFNDNQNKFSKPCFPSSAGPLGNTGAQGNTGATGA